MAKKKMEWTNRFYVPTINEFKIGFIYQYKQLDEVQWNIDVVKGEDYDIVNGDCKIAEIFRDLHSENKKILFRVKMLNADDVLSFGFSKTTPIFVHNKNYNMFTLRGKYNLVLYNDGRQSSVNISDNHDNILYDGIIMNINELEELLDKLEIISTGTYEKKFMNIEYE
jgi:hypothetical protein